MANGISDPKASYSGGAAPQASTGFNPSGSDYIQGGKGILKFWAGLDQADRIMFNADLSNQINLLNIESLELEAIKAEKMGYDQSTRYQSVIDKTIGTQKATYAYQGIDVTSGTAKALQEEDKLTGFLNQLDIQKIARNKAKNLELQASNLRLQGIMQRLQAGSQARAAKAAGFLGGAADVGTAIAGGYGG